MKHILTLLTALLLARLLSPHVKNGEPDTHGHWKLGYKEQFRELADPSVLWFDGKWYLYPSVDMAWVSADNGGTWQHHPLNVRDIGYAPTVVRHRGRFLLARQRPGHLRIVLAPRSVREDRGLSCRPHAKAPPALG